MTIQYMPGWWDSISDNVTKLVGQLPRLLQPNAVAQRKLEDMMQNNPMLMEQFTNMDDGTRAQLAQSLGFRGQNPLGNLPVGEQRRAREEQQAVLGSLTPDQQEQRRAKIAGVETQKDILRRNVKDAREDQEFDWKRQIMATDIPARAVEAESRKLLLDEQKRAVGVLEAARAKYPQVDFNKIWRALNDPSKMDDEVQGMMTVVSGDKSLAGAFETIVDIEKIKMNARNQFSLRNLSQQDDVNRLLMQNVTLAQREYNQANNYIQGVLKQAKLAGISIEEALKIDSERKRLYDEAVVRASEAKAQYDRFSPALTSALKKQGHEIPDIKLEETPVAPQVDAAKIDKVAKSVKEGRVTREQALSSTMLTEDEKLALVEALGTEAAAPKKKGFAPLAPLKPLRK